MKYECDMVLTCTNTHADSSTPCMPLSNRPPEVITNLAGRACEGTVIIIVGGYSTEIMLVALCCAFAVMPGAELACADPAGISSQPKGRDSVAGPVHEA